MGRKICSGLFSTTLLQARRFLQCRCFGFQSIIYYYHPMVILAHFNFLILKLHQRNVYNRHFLLFFTSEG